MNYSETIDYLYNAAPAFEKVGASAYKEGLYNTLMLDEHSGHPHRRYLSIHVAGTNGKGSTSHSLAAILQTLGYRVGLFTSPHLITFRERIRVNGEMIPEEYVVEWVKKNRSFFEQLSPSFFELTTAMALEYFASEDVDIAVVEVGLGGRLDCTNIITPILSVITNISFDHTQFLGNTLAKIASEKAGIIKQGVPVVIGEANNKSDDVAADDDVRSVFCAKAKEMNADIIFAEENHIWLDCNFQLKGYYQEKNMQTILNCLMPLAKALKERGLLDGNMPSIVDNIRYALEHVSELTGLRGRWETLSEIPLIICDTGHNLAGWHYLAKQIKETFQKQNSLTNGNSKLHLVFGMVDDKDIDAVMELLPADATYYFTQASTHRAIPSCMVMEKAHDRGLQGKHFSSVSEAFLKAKNAASPEDFIFIGGSSYVVADFLEFISQQ